MDKRHFMKSKTSVSHIYTHQKTFITVEGLNNQVEKMTLCQLTLANFCH